MISAYSFWSFNLLQTSFLKVDINCINDHYNGHIATKNWILTHNRCSCIIHDYALTHFDPISEYFQHIWFDGSVKVINVTLI